MIGDLTFDKASKSVSLFLYSVYLINEFGENGVIRRNRVLNSFVDRMASFMNTNAYDDDGRENRNIFNKSLYAQYYGFISRFKEGRDEYLFLTERGKKLLPFISLNQNDNINSCSILPENRRQVQDLLLESILFDPHGKHNEGAQDSNTDVAPLGVIFKTLIKLGHASNDEIFYVLFALNKGDDGRLDINKSFDELISDIRNNRETHNIVFKDVFSKWKVKNKVQDAKLIDILCDKNFTVLTKKSGDNNIEYNYIDDSCQRFISQSSLINEVYHPLQLFLYSSNCQLTDYWIRDSLLGRFRLGDPGHFRVDDATDRDSLIKSINEAVSFARGNDSQDSYLIINATSEKEFENLFSDYLPLIEREPDYTSSTFGCSLKSITQADGSTISFPSNLHIIVSLLLNSIDMSSTLFDGSFKRIHIDNEEMETKDEPETNTKDHRDEIKEEFKYYLSNCVKSSKIVEGNYTLGESAVSSYLSFLEPKNLFDYNPDKWSDIESMYDYTKSERVDKILKELLDDSDFVAKDKGTSQYWRSGSIMYYSLFIHAREYFLNIANINKSKNMFSSFFDEQVATDYRRFVNAFMTKPFVLLAGISGTGKSRIVRQFAQATDNIDKFEKESDRWALHKPENFELIQVKPNWHNSLDVVGYKSNIGGAHYEFTPFVEFIAKAWMNPNTPFFLCLDEMNLAPVEQYFAEYLSAIESRSFDEKTRQYETDPIIKPFNSFGKKVADEMIEHLLGDKVFEQKQAIEERFRKKGLTLPQNLIVMGTVNMDETTFSFSRKVLDRAMSIEMNEVVFQNCITPSPTDNPPVMVDDNHQIISRPIKSITVIEGNDSFDSSRTLLDLEEANSVVSYLDEINKVLDGTPFKLGYRACNEALLYIRASKESSHVKDYMEQALDEFTLMKILSRIEGDKRSVGNLLDQLQQVITEKYPKSNKKLREMAATLGSKQFVSYWT